MDTDSFTKRLADFIEEARGNGVPAIAVYRALDELRTVYQREAKREEIEGLDRFKRK